MRYLNEILIRVFSVIENIVSFLFIYVTSVFVHVTINIFLWKMIA